MPDPGAQSDPDRAAQRNRIPWMIPLAVFALTVGIGLYLTSGSTAEVGKPPARVATAPPQPPPAASIGQKIEIPTLGLSLYRPDGWVTVTADQNAQNLRRVHMDDRQFQELAARYANSPVVAIAKYKEPYADLNPSFKINVRPIGGFANRAPEEILAAALPTFGRAFRDLRILEGPRPSQVSGRRAAYARVAYTLRAGDLAVPTVSELWIVPKGSVFFMIGAGTRADEKNGTRAETGRILDSLRIE